MTGYKYEFDNLQEGVFTFGRSPLFNNEFIPHELSILLTQFAIVIPYNKRFYLADCPSKEITYLKLNPTQAYSISEDQLLKIG